MKIKIMLIVSMLTFLGIAGCAMSNEDMRFIKEIGMEKSVIESICSVSSDITLTIQEVPISTPLPEFLTLVYTNNSDSKKYMCSEYFQIEKKFKNTWYVFPYVEGYGVIDIGYPLNPLSEVEVKCYFSQYHKNMHSGLYRIVCQVRNIHDQHYSNVVCEFSIDQE